MSQYINIPTAGMHCISAYRADPAGTPRGGIVVMQEIFGVNAHIRRVVDSYAEAGYVAIAPAIFDYLENGVELDYDEAGVARGRALAADRVPVNSMHHQGIKDLAPGLVPSAWAPDGLIEGVEGANGHYLVAVQWHPEELTDTPGQRRLFTEFLAASAGG